MLYVVDPTSACTELLTCFEKLGRAQKDLENYGFEDLNQGEFFFARGLISNPPLLLNICQCKCLIMCCTTALRSAPSSQCSYFFVHLLSGSIYIDNINNILGQGLGSQPCSSPDNCILLVSSVLSCLITFALC